jgi:hypothetical protein
MLGELNELFKEAYNSFKRVMTHKIPLEMIKKYLEIEGIDVNEEYRRKEGR